MVTRTARAINESVPRSQMFRAVVRAVDTDGRLVVAVNGNDIKVASLTGYSPAIGDPVLCAIVDGEAILIGALSTKNRPGTIVVSDPPVNVDGDLVLGEDDWGGEWQIPFLSTYTPTAGDRVAVSWGDHRGIILGVRAAITQGQAPPTPGGTGATNGTDVFRALDAGSYRSGKWRTDSDVVAQADWGGWGFNYGAWFYGGTPQQKLSGATITSAAIYLPRRQGGTFAAQTLGLWRHTSDSRPAGDVARVDGPYNIASPPVNQTQWISIPIALAQNIVNGGTGGLGLNGSAYVVLSGLSQDPMSGALALSWNR